MPRRPRRVRRYLFNDVDHCIVGRCIGARCPCLCHVESLRLAHYNGQLVRRRGRVRGVMRNRKSVERAAPTAVASRGAEASTVRYHPGRDAGRGSALGLRIGDQRRARHSGRWGAVRRAEADMAGVGSRANRRTGTCVNLLRRNHPTSGMASATAARDAMKVCPGCKKQVKQPPHSKCDRCTNWCTCQKSPR
jgi:hypothetical protein